MSATLGQGRAFKLIDTCLRAITSVVGAQHGAISGTLSERMMATFSSADDAVAAAVALQRAIAEAVGDAGVDTTRLLQVSIHEGPCLAATVADRLGYFGATPSTTLRLLDAAAGGEIVLSPEALSDPLVSLRLLAEDLPEHLTQISLPSGVVEICRLRCWVAPAALTRVA